MPSPTSRFSKWPCEKLFRQGTLPPVEQNGWQLKRIKGSHPIYGKPGERALIVVPVHGNQSLKPGLQRAVLKLAGIEP